jgi:O-antigen/teichoic acid export membrane protein
VNVGELGTLIRRNLADPMLRSSALLAINSVLGAAAGFIYWTIAARNYGPSAIGAVSAVTALIPLVTTLASLGLAEMLVRHYAGSENQLRMLTRAAVTLTVTTVGLALAWWALAGNRSPLNEVGSGVGLLLILLFTVLSCGTGLLTTATLIASRRSDLVIIETVAGIIVRIATLLLLRDQGAGGILLSFAAGASATTLTGGALVLTRVRPRRGTGVGIERDHHHFALINWLSAVFALGPRAATTSLIVWRAGTEAAAWVAVPLMMLPLMTMIPSVVGRSLFSEGSRNPQRILVLARRAFLVAGALTALSSTFIALAAPLVLRVFGERYAAESTTLLRLLALAALCAVPNYILDVTLNVSGHRGGFLFVNITGVLAASVLLVLLSGHGPAGIGIAWVAGQLAYGAIATTTWRRVRHRPRGEAAQERPGDPEEQALGSVG